MKLRKLVKLIDLSEIDKVRIFDDVHEYPIATGSFVNLSAAAARDRDYVKDLVYEDLKQDIYEYILFSKLCERKVCKALESGTAAIRFWKNDLNENELVLSVKGEKND